MPIVPLNQVPQAPGVYPVLGLAGNFSTQVDNPGRCYLIGTASTGSSMPTRIASVEELTSVFGTVPQVNLDVADVFFRSLGSLGELYYVRVPGIVAPASITVAGVVSALNSFNPEIHSHGFVICPEGYSYLLALTDRLALYNALQGFVSNMDFNWIHVADASMPAEFYGNNVTVTSPSGKVIRSTVNLTVTAPNTAGNINTALAALSTFYQTEALTYTSPDGHSSYAANPAIHLSGRLIPASIGTVVAAQRRYAQDSYRVAPAGVKAPLAGVVGVYADFTKTHQAALNGANINILRLVSGYGVCMNGARTRYTADSAFRFIHVRVIFNVLIADLNRAYQPMVFDPIDGMGVTFAQAKGVAVQRLTRLWQAGVLYGQTTSQAFKVVCDASNNPAYDLELGILRVDVYAAPCGVAERILVGVFRVPIGQVPQ